MRKRKPVYKKGDKYPIWFNENAVILEVLPYEGRYPQWFSKVLRVSNKRNTATEVAVE